MPAFNKGNCTVVEADRLRKAETRARDVSQQQDEMNQKGNIKGVGSGHRREFEGHLKNLPGS